MGRARGPCAATEDCQWRHRLIDGEVRDENAWAMGGVAGHAGAFGALHLVSSAARAWLAARVVSAGLHAAAQSCSSVGADTGRFGLGWWLTPMRQLGGPDAGVDGSGSSGTGYGVSPAAALAW
jgi:hypothetical protein